MESLIRLLGLNPQSSDPCFFLDHKSDALFQSQRPTDPTKRVYYRTPSLNQYQVLTT